MRFAKRFAVFLLSVSLLSALPVHAADAFQKHRDEVVTMVNEQRAALGLPEVYEAVELNQAAQIRAEEILNDFSHVRPDGRRGYTIVDDLEIDYMIVAENIAAGLSDEEGVMNVWMNSDGHRKNILRAEFCSLGVGVAQEGDTLYWVQLFSDNPNLTLPYTTGDVNGDQAIDARDAAQVLLDAAQIGAGYAGVLSRMQRSYADVNADGNADAQDAACLLSYAAYVGAGGTDSIEVYLH